MAKRTMTAIAAAAVMAAAATTMAAPAQASYNDRLWMRDQWIDSMTKADCYEFKSYSRWDLKLAARQAWWGGGRDEFHWAYNISRGEYVGGFLWAVRDCY